MKGALKPVARSARKPKRGVIIGMPQNDHGGPAFRAGAIEAGSGESVAEPAPLISGADPDRRQRQGPDRRAVDFHQEGREGHMADRNAVALGHQRDRIEPVGHKVGNQFALARTAEGGVMNFSDGGQIRRFGPSDAHALDIGWR